MEVNYTSKALRDIALWKKTGDKRSQNKITRLIESIQETPFSGLGKPEQLKHNFSGLWSRRINQEHRIIYEVIGDKIILIYSLRGHYMK